MASAGPRLSTRTTLEDEIKSQQRALGIAVESPLKFKGGQYQDARLRLSMLAAMFAVAAEYGQPVRWQREAAGIRDRLAKAASNCKVGTDASYQDAKARFDELAIAGARRIARLGDVDRRAALARRRRPSPC